MVREKRLSGYAGYYKGIYLRSTLEFIYASYLDYKGISWEYEPTVYYTKDGLSYKPDFVLSDGFIVEIKGDYYLEKDKLRIQPFIEELKLDVTFLTSKELRKLIRTTNLSFDKLTTHWKTVAKRDVDVSGDKNPRYNRKVSEDTIRKLSEGVKKAWLDENYRYKQTIGRRGVPNMKIRGERSTRVEVICPTCNSIFKLTEAATKTRKYCSNKCSNVTSNIARIVKMQNKEQRHNELKELVLKYAIDNYNTLSDIKLNKLQIFLKPLISASYTLTGIKDIRVIAEAVTGKPTSRKELIKFLQSYVDDVRRATENDESVELEDKKPLG